MRACLDLLIDVDNLPLFVNNDGHAAAGTIGVIRCAEKQADVASRIHKQREV